MRQQDASLDSQRRVDPGTHRMRCPNCRKLYSVETRHFTASDSGAKRSIQFECQDCDTQFAAILNPETADSDTLDTFIVRSDVGSDLRLRQKPAFPAPTVGRTCPKCSAKNVSAALECHSCGIVFARYKPGEEERVMSEIQLAGRLELVSMWDGIAADYQNLELHQSFVLACDKAGCLPFASHKYTGILNVAPEEEIARRMRKQIVGLASRKFDSAPVTAFKFPLPSFNSLILLLGTVAFLFGASFPKAHAADVTAIGGAMVALAIGMRVFLRRPE